LDRRSWPGRGVRRRQVLLSVAAALVAGCGGLQTGARPTSPPVPSTPTSAPPTPVGAPATPTPRPVPPTATTLPTATTVPAATVAPTATALPTAPATATAAPTPAPLGADEVLLDLHLWNGAAELQLDGETVPTGRLVVPAGPHQAAALLDDEPVAIVETPADGGRVDLVVPPPQAALAVMVENQAAARPQSGLPQADVVYECLAEGGISRFVAIFLSGDAPVVGPVRSLRHYFAFLAADYGADLIHIGASPEGFAWRDAMNLGKLDESAGDPGVWRVGGRPVPHNAYTNTADDRGYLRARGWQQGRSWGPLRFSSQAPLGSESATSIAIGFRPWPYRVGYTWDADSGTYARSMEGVPHDDAETGEPIAPVSVVVQFADVEPIPDDPKLRLDIDLVGASGDLVIFSGGTCRRGSWRKDEPLAATIWLDETGEPLVLPPGQVWVEVVPLGSRVVWT